MSEERKMILKMVQEGRMNIDEADKLLAALEKPTAAPQEPTPEPQPKTATSPKMEQMFGSLSSFLETVTQQWGSSLEKKVSQLFQTGKPSHTTNIANRTQEEQKLSLGEKVDTLEVFNPYGEIKVTSSPDQQIHVVLEKLSEQPSPEEANRLFQLCRIKWEENSSLFRLYLEEHDTLKKGSVSAHLKLEVPKHLHLKLASVNDDLHLEQWSAPEQHCQMRTTKGDIYCQQVASLDTRLETINGNIYSDTRGQQLHIHSHGGDVKAFGQCQDAKLQTQSGQIQFQGQATHSLHIETTSGDVTVKLPSGPCPLLEVSANSGDLLLEGHVGKTKLTTISGDIEGILTFHEPAQLEGTSNSGDIALAMPQLPASGFALEATSNSGDIECRLELEATVTSEFHLKGKWGAAQTTIGLKTGSGDILISK